MRTINELIHYCNESNPIGALMLTGEPGCGKTYLIKKELTKALADSHIIIRISLFGMESAKTLKNAVHQKWLEACMPVLGSVQKARDKGVFSAFSAALRRINPLAGGAASIVLSMNMVDMVTIKPVVEDFITHKKKRVVFVYDDLDRAKMDITEMMGVINDFCENKRFNSIVIANDESILEERESDKITYHLLREKTISQMLYHIPDYNEVISAVLNAEKWQTEEYADYLTAHEELIRDVFVTEPKKKGNGYFLSRDRKYHSFRSLTKGLQNFYRIYYHIKELGSEVDDIKLYSFLSYYLVEKCGICRGGVPDIECSDDDIKEFYSKYVPEQVTASERYWISTGIWDKDAFKKEFMQTAKKGTKKKAGKATPAE